MFAKASRYEELTSVFPDHQLTLDLTVEAIDTWPVVQFCTDLFSRYNFELFRILRGPAQTLSFRLDCQNHSDISSLDEIFQTCDAPKRKGWTITVGRKKRTG